MISYLCALLLLATTAFAQSAVQESASQEYADFQLITSANSSLQYVPASAPNFFDERQTSELTLLLSSVVRLYQITISSQDASLCAFTPSCSRFAMLALQKTSFLRAFLLSGDRLLRCNGLGFKLHAPDPLTGKYPDPVEDYLHLEHND